MSYVVMSYSEYKHKHNDLNVFSSEWEAYLFAAYNSTSVIPMLVIHSDIPPVTMKDQVAAVFYNGTKIWEWSESFDA